ncbi:hypothetical protein M5K25_027837 [Dendrobium thyrsiflorum]|uniref:Uncharacterized protein n=1 Tax=Dendrobium thyrsiflorum TaxID=117978 RepID=A0ABD0TUW3_DENTH
MDQQFEVGTVGQAFCSALQDKLSDYYKLLAVLESQSANPIPLAESDSGGSPGNYLSLRRLFVWLAEPMVRMRPIALLVDGCQELRGGAMARVIHAHALYGDPLVQEFTSRLLRRVCSPLFETRILRMGKSINFLCVCCEDNSWAEAAAKVAAHVGAATKRGGLGYGETNALEALAIEAAKRIFRHLMDVIHKRYRFKDHCLAIKRYLLLGQGNLVQYLMDIVGPELSKPANTISSFQLAGLLETIVRTSNAQYDDREILYRLKVRMMDHGDGETKLNDNYNIGVKDVFIAGVQMIDVQSTNKAYPIQRSQAIRRNVTKGWDPKFIGPKDGKLITAVVPSAKDDKSIARERKCGDKGEAWRARGGYECRNEDGEDVDLLSRSVIVRSEDWVGKSTRLPEGDFSVLPHSVVNVEGVAHLTGIY